VLAATTAVVNHQLVLQQIFRPLRHAGGGKIAGRADHTLLYLTQFTGGKARIFQLADTQGNIDALFNQRQVAVIQQQIERLPWIKQASVRKQWPDELKIHLVEYVPVARWNDLHMVDAEGKAFSVPAERAGKQKLPLLYGPEGSEQDVLEGYRAMSATLAASKYTLKMAAMTARHSWQLALDNDVRLELGRDDRNGRLQRFIELYPVLQQQGQAESKRVSYVDLRYESGA